MRRPLLLVALFLVATCVFSQSPSRQVTTSGSASIEARPDYLRFVLVVTCKGPDLSQCKKCSDLSVSSLAEGLRKLGIPIADITISDFHQGKDIDFTDKGPVQRGFYSSKDVLITLRDLSLVSSVNEMLSLDPNVDLRATKAHCKEYAELQAQARSSAFNLAQDKARALATLAGLKLGKALAIEDQSASEGDDLDGMSDVKVMPGYRPDPLQTLGIMVVVGAHVQTSFEMGE